MFKSLFLIVIVALAGLISAIATGEKNPLEIDHGCRNVTGHLDCTAYYKPCAVSCSRRYLTPYQTLLGLVNAINNDYDLFFQTFDPQIIITNLFGSQVQGVCQIINAFNEELPANWYAEIGEVVQDGPSNGNFAQQKAYLNFYNSSSVYQNSIYLTSTLVKNACNNWVYTLTNSYYYD